MGTVEAEAAASLFGSADSTLADSDPFSAVLGNDNAPADAPSADREALQADADPSSLFDVGGSSSDANGYNYDNWLSQADDHQKSYAPTTQEASTSYTTAAQGYDQSNQWAGYDESQQTHGYVAANGTYGSMDYAAQSAPNPYAPTSYSTTSSSYDSHVNGSQPASHYATSSYEPYAPQSTTTISTQAASFGYAPSNYTSAAQHTRSETSSSSASAYDPYKPSITTVSSPYAPPQYPSTRNAPPVVTAPPPPAPKADVYRPKSFNAYDPPLPPVKPKHRPVHSPPVSVYSPYGSHIPPPPVSPYIQSPNAAAPPLPPPPRAPSTGVRSTRSNTGSTDYSRAYSPSPANGTKAGYASPTPAQSDGAGITAGDAHSRSLSPPYGSAAASHQPHEYAPASPESVPTLSMEQHVQSLTTAVEELNLSEHSPSFQPPSLLPSQDISAIFDAEVDPESTATAFAQTSETVLPSEQDPEAPSHSIFQPPALPEHPSAPSAETMKQVLDRTTSPDRASIRSVGSVKSNSSRATQPLGVVPPPPASNTYSYDPERSSNRSSLDQYAPSKPPAPPTTAVSGYDPYVPAKSPATSPPPAASAGSSYDPYVPAKSPPISPPASTRSSLDRYAPAKVSAISPAPPALNGYALPHPASIDTYKPNGAAAPPRAKSPGAASVRSFTSSYGSHGPYSTSSRSQSPVVAAPPRDRAISNSVQYAPPPPIAAVAASPYAPPVYGITRESSELSDYGEAWSSRSYGSPSGLSYVPPAASAVAELDHGQDVYLSTPARAPYAPSPTLLGANDPLGRVAARAPLVTFGFGGKVLTCFHGSSELSTGFDVALSSKPSTDIRMRLLHKVLPESASDVSVPAYPGPLFSDPGTPTTTSLVRTSASQVKAKKAKVIKYLEEKEEELSRAVSYLTKGTAEHRRAEGKLVLAKLLKIMVENDGKLSGSEAADSAARAALVPRIQSATDNGDAGLTAAADLSLGYPGLASSNADEIPLASYVVTPSSLNKIQDFLLRGERRKACHYALDHKLWAHAMLIASSVDKEAWKEVVHEFLRTELGYKADSSQGSSPVNGKAADPGRTSLRVAYSLFAGEGAASVQEMVPPKLLSKTESHTLQLPQPAASLITPVSPNFPSAALTSKVPDEVLADWSDTAAMLLSNPMTADSSSALTTLGDYLSANQWIEAAHACYLLSPQTSMLGGVGSPSVRVVLVGSTSPQMFTGFNKDHDPIIFSEIAEFALSLASPAKGQEMFSGLPHLQAYKLLRATTLAELGHVQLANRYCDAIRTTVTKQSPYLNVAFMHCLKELSDRLTATPQVDKAGSWIGGKMSKPSLDSIGSWVGSRVTKFIAGEEDRSPTDDPSRRSSQEDSPFSGPFTHYSAISSAVPSHTPSPAPSVHSIGYPSTSPPPRRSGSAMALRPNPHSDMSVDRASSAMDYTRPSARKSSPALRSGSTDAATVVGQVPSFGQAVNGYGSGNGYPAYPASPAYPGSPAYPHSPFSTDDASGSQNSSSWWNGSGYGAENDAITPTASSFHQVNDGDGEADAGNFVSLMDDTMTPVATTHSPAPNGSTYEEDDVEDLGFGNSSKRKAEASEVPEQDEAKESEKKPDAEELSGKSAPGKPPLASASSGSWLSRWWKRENTPAPVKANLGEEVTFYYDAELKRWVNKKAGGDTSQPKPPPPPPARAQTASPSRSAPGLTPPPARPASAAAVDLTSPPVKKPPMRVRSNLVPEGIESAPTTPAAHAGLEVPPPPGRPKSQMGKRSVRSRYVDVFQPTPGS
ncbi:hypothetical protein OE88DRAFT_1732154 [Heliocybe sulcata]|uniref:Protein transport protein sec16 n=1 Tax=Heliocybe sulcata TaxID=5364 RepID=A0A5C3NFP0_9AGAM|nr:hypothetical protein OE88DRAFT_1732154 [Heliocybe sulcata]